jgi:hypothetical protein
VALSGRIPPDGEPGDGEEDSKKDEVGAEQADRHNRVGREEQKKEGEYGGTGSREEPVLGGQGTLAHPDAGVQLEKTGHGCPGADDEEKESMAASVEAEGHHSCDQTDDALDEEKPAIDRHRQSSRTRQKQQQARSESESAEGDEPQLGGVITVEGDYRGGYHRNHGATNSHGPVSGSDV